MIINNEMAYPYRKNANYSVTKSGKIYSTYVIGGRGSCDIYRPHLLSYGTDKDGYYRVVLSLNGEKRYVKVHTVMVEQFIGNIPDSMVVNHKDCNIHNNDIDNLEIVTPRENTIHAHKNFRSSCAMIVRVEFEDQTLVFPSKAACTERFPELSKWYLDCVQNGIMHSSMLYFVKRDKSSRISPIDVFYNGTCIGTYANMQEAGLEYGLSRGCVSAAIKSGTRGKAWNRYHITFPNVSTIESIA